jgi:hypothetical protein
VIELPPPFDRRPTRLQAKTGPIPPPFASPALQGSVSSRAPDRSPPPFTRLRTVQAAAAATYKVVVLSGHGQFNLNRLPTKNDLYFVVPEDVTIIFYAPPGAALENDVANAIEVGNFPSADKLELKHGDTTKTVGLPGAFPYTFGKGAKVLNFTLDPPGNLKVQAPDAKSGIQQVVLKKGERKTLAELVAEQKGSKVVIHWAACGAAHVLGMDLVFPYRGYYCRFK